MSKSNASKSHPLSRRGFLRTSALGAAAGSLMLGGSTRAEAVEGGDLLQELATTLLELKASQPELPGFASLDEFISAAHPGELSEEELGVLRGGLYLRASRLLELTGGFPPASSFAPALEQRLPTDMLGQGFFSTILKETQERMEADGEYAERVHSANELALQFEGQGSDDPSAFPLPLLWRGAHLPGAPRHHRYEQLNPFREVA